MVKKKKKINSTGLRLTPLDVRSRLVAVLRPFALRREFYGHRLESMANQSLGNVSGPALLKKLHSRSGVIFDFAQLPPLAVCGHLGELGGSQATGARCVVSVYCERRVGQVWCLSVLPLT